MVIFRVSPEDRLISLKTKETTTTKRKQTAEEQQHSAEDMTPSTSADGAIGKQTKCLQYYN
jgi:hypothetical protein